MGENYLADFAMKDAVLEPKTLKLFQKFAYTLLCCISNPADVKAYNFIYTCNHLVNLLHMYIMGVVIVTDTSDIIDIWTPLGLYWYDNNYIIIFIPEMKESGTPEFK